MSAAALVEALRSRGWTVAVAESLTGGWACGELVRVPGASAVVRGGVVAYAPDLKVTQLGVPAALIAERGTIDPDVALAMATGVAHLLGADVGLATTGNAGPEATEGKPVGRVHIAVSVGGIATTRALDLQGDRDTIRTGTVATLLQEAVARLREEIDLGRG